MNRGLSPGMVLAMVESYASARAYASRESSLARGRRAHVFMAWVAVRLSPRQHLGVDREHWALRAWSHLRVARELRRLSRQRVTS